MADVSFFWDVSVLGCRVGFLFVFMICMSVTALDYISVSYMCDSISGWAFSRVRKVSCWRATPMDRFPFAPYLFCTMVDVGS